MTRFVLLIFCLCISLSAQNPSPQASVKRDAQALAAIQAALTALGEDSQNPRIHDCMGDGRESRYPTTSWSTCWGEEEDLLAAAAAADLDLMEPAQAVEIRLIFPQASLTTRRRTSSFRM